MSGIQIQGQNILHMRGDTGILKLNLTSNGEPYEMSGDDVAVFTVKKNTKSEDILLQKTSTDGAFYFDHFDTQNLKAGIYVYDVQLSLSDGQVITVLGPGVYKLLPDVTTNQ